MSTLVAYLGFSGEEVSTWLTVPSWAGPMTAAGTLMTTGATGAGRPFSSSTLTTAWPVPSDVSTRLRSTGLTGKVETAFLRLAASAGVWARSACCTRLPSWARTSSGTSVGDWVMKTMPTPLERMSRTVRTTASRNAFEAPENSRCASSKKNTMVGLSGSPTSGRVSKSSASSHMRKVENSVPWDWMSASSRAEMMPRPSGETRMRSRTSSAGSPKKASPPAASRAAISRRMTPAVAAETPPMVLSSSLPASVFVR